jgi:hypothetical protein
MEDDGFTRIDLAFDFEDDLSNYYAMTDKAVKKCFNQSISSCVSLFGLNSTRILRLSHVSAFTLSYSI